MMNRNLILGALIIFAIFTGAIFINTVSAEKSAGAAPLLSTTIVISQVYSGGGGTTGTYLNDYIELFNLSSAPVSLNGLALQYGAATGQFGSTATNIFALPNVTLQPGQYFLVQTSAAGTGGGPLPVTPDATTTGLSMAGASGKIALTNTTTALGCGATATPCALPDSRIVDLVSYGVSNNGEGGTTVNNGTALATTQGSVRNSNGCAETDNNNADFTVVTAPVPRNSASPVSVCGGAPSPTPTPDAFGDYNGDGRSDWTVVRNTGGGASGQVTWFEQNNGATGNRFEQFGIVGDTFIPEDFDGDGKDDITVWRPGSQAFFYILQSTNNTVRTEQFGVNGDNPTVVGDYDGDNKADPAVFRSNGTATDPCGTGKGAWYYRPSTAPGTNYRYECWGQNGDFAAPGDYDGDGKYDFCVQRPTNGAGVFFLKKSAGGTESFAFGTATDTVVQGDYDGDGKSDICVARGSGGTIQWNILTRTGGGTGANSIVFGNSATDFPLAGDYDGDGKSDIAVWRPSATQGASAFFVRRSTDSGLTVFNWGQNGDYPVNNSFTH